MPIYASDEHQLLSSDCVLHDGEAEIQDGTLYLTDRRILYEKKGKRGIIHATPAKIIMDVNLHELLNVTTAVPFLFGKKILSVEFEKDGARKKYDFQLSDPKNWADEISRWVSDARRHHDEDQSRQEYEKHKKEVELAKAKAPRTNIGMAYFGKGDSKSENAAPRKVESEQETSEGNTQLEQQEKEIPIICPKCGNEVSPEMRFCPHCGSKL